MASKFETTTPGGRHAVARPPKSQHLRLCWAGSVIAMATVAMLALAAADASRFVGSPGTAAANPDTASADMWADTKPVRVSVRASGAPPSAAVPDGLKLFFGYVEFDQNPDAPGGVPGFGPLPNSASQVAEASK
jgi:hypothetical protein